MRPITKLTMCALCAAAFAAPAFAASDYYLKIGDIKSKSAAGSAKGEQIEITSWSWGATQAAARVKKIDSFANKRTADPGGAAAAGGVQVAAGDVNADGRPDVIVADVVSPRDAASGMPAGKRQHGWVTVSKPLDRGSVTVKGSLPGCTVGAAYPDAVLQTDVARYEFKEVFITSCSMPSMSGSSGGDDRPTESISFNYAKIQMVAVPQDPKTKKVQVRGWEPDKKQQN